MGTLCLTIILPNTETQYSTVEVDMMPRALGKLYRFSCDYYTNSEAKKYLSYSQQIAKKNNDQVEYAFATGNLGFAYMREDNMSNAEKCFEEAIKSLMNLRDHEISYARNNIAVISMKRGQYEEASEILKEAHYINRSPYTDLAIVVNMLNCFVNMEKQLDNAKSLFLYLSQNEILKNTHDPVIIRKANNALAYSGCFLNDCTTKDIEKYAKKALDYAIGTSSEKVTLNILNNISAKNRPNKPLFSGDYWLLTYSH